jgi:hypothetical protein
MPWGAEAGLPMAVLTDFSSPSPSRSGPGPSFASGVRAIGIAGVMALIAAMLIEIVPFLYNKTEASAQPFRRRKANVVILYSSARK